jgi:hypothetical protein
LNLLEIKSEPVSIDDGEGRIIEDLVVEGHSIFKRDVTEEEGFGSWKQQ